MRYYQRNIGDLAAATRGLDLVHRGAYDALLDAYYLSERPLPLDRAECYRLADARSPAERRAVDYCLGVFFVQSDDGYRQPRCERELERLRAKSAGCRQAINTRWARERQGRTSPEQEQRDSSVLRPNNDGDTSVIVPITHYPLPKEKAKPTRARVERLPIPEWIPPDLWQVWIEHRDAFGKPLTPAAHNHTVRTLESLKATGEDPVACLKQSIARGWRGVFQLADKPKGSRSADRAANIDRLTGVAEPAAGDTHHANAIESTSERVDRAPVPAIPGPVREPCRHDVG